MQTDLDGIRVRRTLGSVDELVSETLRDGLDVAERRLSGLLSHRKERKKERRSDDDARADSKKSTHSDGEESDGLVNSSQGRHVDSLTTNRALRTDTSGVFTRTGVDDRVDENLTARRTHDTPPASARVHRDGVRGGRERSRAPGWGSGP